MPHSPTASAAPDSAAADASARVSKAHATPSRNAGSPQAGGQRPRRPSRVKTILLLLAGAAVVGAVLYGVGWREVGHLVVSLGWTAPLVLVPYAVSSTLDVLGWRRVLSPHARLRIPFRRLYLIRMAGEAVNSLTPTAGFGGEPVKAYLLRQHGVESSDGVASVVIAKGALISAQIVFTLVGLMLLLDHLEILRARAIFILVGWFIGMGIVAALVAVQRKGLVARSARALRRIGLRGRFVLRLEHAARDVDEALAGFYRDDPRGFLISASFHFVAWSLGGVEVMLILTLMGSHCGWREALIIESLTQASLASGAVIPGGLGVMELSGAVLCRLLGIGEAAGVALMLLKRAREFTFGLVGLVLLSALARRATAEHQDK